MFHYPLMGPRFSKADSTKKAAHSDDFYEKSPLGALKRT